MRKQALAAVGPRHNRHRRPKPAGALLGRDRGAQALADINAIAAVALVAHGMRGNGLRHERLAEALIVRVAAGRQHDAFASPHQDFFSAHVQARAADATPVTGDIDNRRVEQDRHLAFAQTVEQPADERIAHHDARAALIFQAVGEISREQFCGINKISNRVEAADKPGNVGLADHHAAKHHELRHRRTNAPEFRTEEPAVKRLGHYGAAGDGGARHVAAIVRVGSAGKKLHVGAGTQVIDRRWSGLKIGVPQFAIGGLPDQRVQVKIGLFAAIAETGRPALTVSRNPKRAGRGRSGAANLVGLLAQEHFETLERGNQRGSHACRSRARDQKIDLPVGVCIHCRIRHRRRMSCRNDAVIRPPGGYMSANIKCDNCDSLVV